MTEPNPNQASQAKKEVILNPAESYLHNRCMRAEADALSMVLQIKDLLGRIAILESHIEKLQPKKAKEGSE